MTVPQSHSIFKDCVPLASKVSIAAFDSGQPPPAQDYAQAWSYIAALTQGDPNTAIIDIRLIHDKDRSKPAIPRRGTLPQLWPEIIEWQTKGHGCFVAINELDGNGREIANVKTIRCQAIDLDNLSAQQNYERARQFNPAPSFAVQSSQEKYHCYWITRQHHDRKKFTVNQRKLKTLFGGDGSIIDASRVLRLPGTLHLKEQPHLITCWALGSYGTLIDPGILEIALHGVNVIDESGGRHDLAGC